MEIITINLQDRIYRSFDYLRVFSTFMIVLCHLSFLKPEYFFVGSYLSSFVEVFFILSALLLGFKYSGVRLTWFNFIKNRVIRLITSYYPYLMFLFCWIYFVHHEEVSIKIILSHVFFIHWFTRTFDYSYGHLWFLSMLMLCYIYIMAISRLKIKIDGRLIFYFTLLSIFAFIVCYQLKINPRIVTSLLLYTLFFYKGKIFLNYIIKLKISFATLIFFGVNTVGLYLLYKSDGLVDFKMLSATLSSLMAVTNALFFIKIFMFLPKSKVLNFFSLISFELYLIHHPLILGRYSVIYSLTENLSLNILITLLMVLVLSFFLYFISLNLNKVIFN